MKKHYLLTVLLCCCVCHLIKAQHQSIYGSYYFNPEIYNPSFTGTGRTFEVSLMHKKQWLGIEEAPVNSSLNLQIPTQTRASLGFTLLSDKSVLLRKTSLLSTFAYMIPLGKNHYFQFGISGGVASQSISLDNINTADPAIMQAAQSQIQWLGQFGAHYRNDHFILGISVPQYQFTVPVSGQVIENHDYFRWSHRMHMVMAAAHYRLPLIPDKIELEPAIIYSVINQSSNQIELTSILYLQDIVWIGASYRQQNGLSAMAGIKIKQKLKIGYAYAMASGVASHYSSGTHELQMSITPGKIKNIRH